ncbi:MAG: hypothetical protein JW997_02005, partial [Actinobacteria bacterium]|nr:hypothetical protein [Actinomycetota bacterium]
INDALNLRNTYSKSQKGQEKKFYKNLHEFLVFLNIFSKSFYNNYYHLSSLVFEFKNNELKEVYAEIISDLYKNYISELEDIKAPAFIRPSLKIYLCALEKFKMYYCLYNDYTDNSAVLAVLWKSAESLEQRFLRRLNKVNEFFKCRLANF